MNLWITPAYLPTNADELQFGVMDWDTGHGGQIIISREELSANHDPVSFVKLLNEKLSPLMRQMIELGDGWKLRVEP